MDRITKCACPNCGVHVEFDASELAPKEVRKGPCPSCGGDMWFLDNSRPEKLAALAGRKMRSALATLSTLCKSKPDQSPFRRSVKLRWHLIWFIPALPVIIWLVYREAFQLYDQKAQREMAVALAEAEQNKPAPEAEPPPIDGRVFDEDKKCPHVETATEIIQSGWKSSTITTKYKIRYISQQCLEVVREVKVEPSQDILSKWSALHHGFLDNPGDTAQDGAGNSNKSDVERELAAWDKYEHDQKWHSTTFQILRKDADVILQWLAKYHQWTQASRSEHLANGITNTLPTCDYQQLNSEAHPYWKSVGFVTPNILLIGADDWNERDVANLERLMATMPALDEKLRRAIADREAEQARVARDKQQELQTRQAEIDRAQAVLQ